MFFCLYAMRYWVGSNGNEDNTLFHQVAYETCRNMTDLDNTKRKHSNGKGDGRFKKWFKKGAIDQETRLVVNGNSVENSEQPGSIEAAGHEKKLEQTEPSNGDSV
jgi:hypothetical protein